MGLGSPPIKIFEKVASQSGNLILLFHMNKTKEKTIRISIFVETWMDPRPAKCPDFSGTIPIFRPCPGCPGKRLIYTDF